MFDVRSEVTGVSDGGADPCHNLELGDPASVEGRLGAHDCFWGGPPVEVVRCDFDRFLPDCWGVTGGCSAIGLSLWEGVEGGCGRVRDGRPRSFVEAERLKTFVCV